MTFRVQLDRDRTSIADGMVGTWWLHSLGRFLAQVLARTDLSEVLSDLRVFCKPM